MAEEKKEMQRVNISMFGLSYQLKTDDPARLKRLAAEGDRRIKEMSRRVRSFDVKRIAALTVLQMMDEYDQLKHDYDELVQLLEEK
ncbi:MULTISPECIES: cell division protein ZapA [Selenomonas]|jgi:hypothetical protein|uniref:Cell division protein ZapA n=2 Tax=Selenomonas TaxID=970 RepID=E7N044_9FIRM|nr:MULTISPECIES: cell division protein ZapA [Selenomonas]EFW30708.1 hypothetical protein HMPREF9555_00337 [Selenomonas artemidis F0399]EJP33773.1 cell division protein ZapA [Selenomonas sp. FOBRC9]MBF1683048.1 cell division protein ZapA [Selenomonas artemidis]